MAADSCDLPPAPDRRVLSLQDPRPLTPRTPGYRCYLGQNVCRGQGMTPVFE